MNTNYDVTMTNFEEHLNEKSGHNTIARNLSGSSSNGFMSEVLTGRNRYFLKIRVDEKIDCVIMEAYPGIRVPEPYRAMTASFCMQKNAEKKVGNLVLDPDQGDIHCHVEASFHDAPLTGETLEKMEHIVITFLMSCQEDLERVSHGMMPTSDNKGNDIRNLMKKMMGNSHSGSNSGLPIFPDFLHASSDDDDADLPDFIHADDKENGMSFADFLRASSGDE